MMALMVVLYLIIAVMLLFVGFGWIIPLVIGMAWRRKNRPGARGWMIASFIWAGVGLALAAGIGGLVLVVKRNVSNYAMGGDDSKIPVFAANAYKGETATLRAQFSGESSFTASCGKQGNLKFSSTNGSFTVPAGSVMIHSYTAVAKDSAGRKWTAHTTLAFNTNAVDAASGAVRDINLGPPFKASVNMSWSAASDKISMEPVYVDRDGNECELASEPRTASPPHFQFLDSSNNVVWSGAFQYG
jgi:hypothetical protein